MRASSPRKALVWPKCLFTPAITTAVSSWRSGAAAGDGVLAAMSAVAGAGIACGGPGRVADFDGHRHALTQPGSGRASGRERGGQDVSVRVGAVELKKKKQT